MLHIEPQSLDFHRRHDVADNALETQGLHFGIQWYSLGRVKEAA